MDGRIEGTSQYRRPSLGDVVIKGIGIQLEQSVPEADGALLAEGVVDAFLS